MMATDVADVSGVTNKILTHEVGAGAKCLKCGDKCPGLDLHFWRKICRNCKCKQEDHAVLDSVSSRGIENIGKLLMYDQQDNATNGQFQKSSPEHVNTTTVSKPVNEKTNTIVEQKIVANQQAHAGQTSPQKSSISTNTTEQNDPLKITIDIGGKTTNLDFGHLNLDDLPPPPQEEVEQTPDLPPPPTESYEKSTATSATEVEPPPIPPLPQEPKQASPVKEAPKPQDPSKTTTYVTKDTSSPLKTKQAPSNVANQTSKVVNYDWTPPVENQKLAKEYLEALPEDKRPIAGTDGSQYRKKQLMRQLPPHDQEPSACHDLTPQEKDEMEVFVTQYQKKALGVGKVDEVDKVKVCEGCQEALKVCDVYVWAERASKEKYWHPNCFKCSECKELLVDLIYFYHDDKIYCGRHYCELHKPRCAACDELIFAPEYTQAEDCYWHLKHFCCWQCDQPLGGKNYVPHENQPVCIPCYEKSFAHRCATCAKVIAPNIEWVTFQEFHWHALPECFRCTNCSQSLVGKPCIPKDGMVFCSSKCKKEKMG